MTVLMVSSEVAPFAKTGGMADAVPSLAKAMKDRGHDLGILMPRYYEIDRRFLKKLPAPLSVHLGTEELWCSVYETRLPGTDVPVWMLEREDLFGRHGLYGPDGSTAWPDNARRFSFLSAAVFQLSRYLKRIPDILHLHDWQAAPAAWLLKHHERYRGFESTVSVLTIHNLGYQGIFSMKESAHYFPTDALGFNDLLHQGDVNYLATGICNADAVNTVSPTYAQEICTLEYAEGLEKVIAKRAKSITGILNGMDYLSWNPSTDPALKPYNFDLHRLRRKKHLKMKLQQEAGLPVNPNKPLFGMVTRLTTQKGVDLIDYIDAPALKLFKEDKAQLVILGNGEKRYEEALMHVVRAFPSSFSLKIAFSGPYARLIEGGSDFFLMPSRYEPCGLNQLYSLRYGTLPVVRRTGGLADTVTDMNDFPKDGNGFVFDQPQDLGNAIKRATTFYRDKRKLKCARKRAMTLRFDWESAAAGYESMYKQALQG